MGFWARLKMELDFCGEDRQIAILRWHKVDAVNFASMMILLYLQSAECKAPPTLAVISRDVQDKKYRRVV